MLLTEQQLSDSPSRRAGITEKKELFYRQQSASFIQDVGLKLQISQLCINTAILYMHRFFTFHSFTEVERFNFSTAALFLAIKVEDQVRKREVVIRSAQVIQAAHVVYHKHASPLDVRTDVYKDKQFEVIGYENALLQTLGFDLNILHPHMYIVQMCKIVNANRDLSDAAHVLATASLILTTMCLQYKPALVACVCIHLACKWTGWRIDPCSRGKEWYSYLDPTATLDTIETLSQDFLTIFETSDAKFVKRFKNAQQKINSHRKNDDWDVSDGKQKSLENKTAVSREDAPGSLDIAVQVKIPMVSTHQNMHNKIEVDTENVSCRLDTCGEEKVPTPPVKQSISISDYRKRLQQKRVSDPRIGRLKKSPLGGTLSLPLPPFSRSRKRALGTEEGTSRELPSKLRRMDCSGHSSDENTPPKSRSSVQVSAVREIQLLNCL